MTPWWEWVRLMPSSLRRSASTTTTPFSRAAEAMWPRAESVSPFIKKILSMATPARRASMTALRPSMTPSFSVSTGAERRRGGRLFMDIEGDLLIVTAAEYAEVNWNKDTTYYTIFPPGREG